MAHDVSLFEIWSKNDQSPLYAKKPDNSRIFFGENDASYVRSSASLMPSRIPGLNSSDLMAKTRAEDQAKAVASAVHDGDIILSNGPLLQRSRTLPPALKASDLVSPSSSVELSPVPPKTPSGVLPDEGLTASQKVRIGLSGLLLTSEAFRNSTGINSSGKTRRNASPGQTRALNLSQAPISPAHSRTSSQGSSRSVRTEALVAKLIPTKNSVHSLIGYIKELQSSEASLRTHLDTIQTKAQEDLDASYDKVNDLEKSMRQIETERQRNAMELELKAREIDELQRKIQELRKAIEKIPPSVLSQLDQDDDELSNEQDLNEQQELNEDQDLNEEQDLMPNASPQLSPTESERDILSTPPTFEQVLVEFYELWEPAKMKNVPVLARQYSGNERALVDELEKKYGSEAVGPLEAVYPKELSRSASEVDSELVPEDSSPPTPYAPFIMTSETFMNEPTVENESPSQNSPFKPLTILFPES
ncbi:hypothetical protein THRCLA_10334 [Thraustotheca clavata]|uniref:Uncharacterized protein n=1 Tax=Thraustotheca clavata TaxID=74557 RepID=A0A1V9YRL0_9STRA|nr:hypothetical protein THRCLA_10334 [Thraustotheca clavata]